MTLTARQLLRTLDQLPFAERQQLVARTARDLVGTSDLNRLITDLKDGDRWSRGVALRLATIAEHRDWIVSGLDDPDPALAAWAVAAAVRLMFGTEELLARLEDLSPELRRVLYSACRRHGATALAEQLLPQVRERWGDKEAAALVSACSPETVASLLPELDYAIASWPSLARRHPGEVLAFARAQLDEIPPASWAELWQRIGPGIEQLSITEPSLVLGLLERSNARVGIPTALLKSMAALARHDPERVLRLVVDPRRAGACPAGRKFWRAFADVSDADLVHLARVAGNQNLRPLLHALPPRRRTAIFDGLLAGRNFVEKGLSLSILDELPSAIRHSEAARLLALPSVAEDPHVRLQVTARLDWEDGGPVLLSAARRPKPEERAEAYSLYMSCAAASRNPEIVGSMLGTLGRLANDQDPVRVAALLAISQIPARLFRDVDAEVLRTLMTDALQARDCSQGTKAAVTALSRALVREGAISGRGPLVTVGLDGLSLLGQYVSRVGLAGLDRALPRGTEQLVFASLKPRLVADARVGRYTTTLALASGLGRRAWAMAELQDLVDQARTATDDGVVREAITLWLAPIETRNARVERILRDDRSTILIHGVQSAVAHRRPDLLDDLFRLPQHGRFLKQGVRFVPLLHGCFRSWLPRQTSAYSEQLMSLATAPGVSVQQRVGAVRTLGRVPGTVENVRLMTGDSEVAVQEAALAALAWGDNPAAAIPDLLVHSQDDRSRVAVYALARCTRFVAVGELSGWLAPLLTSPKVTTRKEAVRLLAEHRVPGAPDLLAQVWADPAQHRDVKRAVAVASRFLLDHESSWELLGAASADPATATAVLDVTPSEIPQRSRERFAALICAVASSSDSDVARRGLVILPGWAQWSGLSGIHVASVRVTDLDSTSAWRTAIHSLVASCDILNETEPLLRVTSELIALLEVEHNDRDQPARQRLAEVASRLQSQVGRSVDLRRASAGVVQLLAPVASTAAINLAAAALAWDEPVAVASALLDIAEIAHRPIQAESARRAIQGSLSRVLNRLDPADIYELASVLTADGGSASGLIGLGVVQTAGRAWQWPQPWRELLFALRVHDDPDVRVGALETFVAPE